MQTCASEHTKRLKQINANSGLKWTLRAMKEYKANKMLKIPIFLRRSFKCFKIIHLPWTLHSMYPCSEMQQWTSVDRGFQQTSSAELTPRDHGYGAGAYVPAFAGTHCDICTKGWPGWVVLGDWLYTPRRFIRPLPVTHPGTNRARRRVLYHCTMAKGRVTTVKIKSYTDPLFLCSCPLTESRDSRCSLTVLCSNKS